MPIDPSIILGIKPPQLAAPDPLDQYSKSLTLSALLGQQELQGLQTQQARLGLSDDAATRAAYQQSGGDPTTLRALLSKGGQYKAVEAFDKARLDNDTKRATIEHTKAQTREISVGEMAGGLAALARSGGSDDSVQHVVDLVTPVLGAEHADSLKGTLMSMSPADRVSFMIQQASQHKNGIEALKVAFPAAHMQDTGASVVPVSTSTMPGGPAPGSAIPGAVPIAKTMTPSEVESGRHNRVSEGQGAARLGIERENQNIHRAQVDPMGILGINKNPSSAAVAGAALSGEDYLKTLPPGVAAQVKGITDGKIQLSPMTMRSPQGAALLQMAMQYEPGTDQTVYASRAATAKDAASGKLATSNNALNTVAGHLAGLADAADKLNNTSFPWVNTVKNFALNAAGDPRVKEFNLNMQGVADELERAYRGAGGSEHSIALWRDTLGNSSSPEQFKSVLKKGAEMLQSKLEANQAQYTQGMHGKPGDYRSVTPKAAEAFARLRGESPAPAAPAPSAAAVRIKGDDGYNALAKGAHYIGPDGVERVK